MKVQCMKNYFKKETINGINFDVCVFEELETTIILDKDTFLPWKTIEPIIIEKRLEFLNGNIHSLKSVVKKGQKVNCFLYSYKDENSLRIFKEIIT